MEFNATFLVSTVSFIFFVIIMNAIFYKPLQKIVLERQKFIDETNQEAKLAQEKSESILKDRDEKLERTRADAKRLILNETENIKAKKSEMTSIAQKEAFEKIENAKSELYSSKNNVQSVLQDEAKNIADVITSKILG